MDKRVLRKRLRELHKPDRMLALSDGVVAVAIMLLVLDLRVPASAKGSDDAALLRDLVALLPTLAMYVLSFLVVGLAWLGHHRKFTYIHHIDSGLLWLNMFFLMTVVLVPYATAVQSQSQTRTAEAFYSGTLCLLMAFSAAISAYAIRRPDIFDVGTPVSVQRQLLLSPVLSSIIFAVATVVALVHVGWGPYVMLLAIPIGVFTGVREPATSA